MNTPRPKRQIEMTDPTYANSDWSGASAPDIISVAFPDGRTISYDQRDLAAATAGVQWARSTDALAGPHVWARYAIILCAELMRTREERDLALEHDTQPYPTAWAYEQACKALDFAKAQAHDMLVTGERYVDATQNLELEMRARPGLVYGQMKSWAEYDAARSAWDEAALRLPAKESPCPTSAP